jgi:hypothetical protein
VATKFNLLSAKGVQFIRQHFNKGNGMIREGILKKRKDGLTQTKFVVGARQRTKRKEKKSENSGGETKNEKPLFNFCGDLMRISAHCRIDEEKNGSSVCEGNEMFLFSPNSLYLCAALK